MSQDQQIVADTVNGTPVVEEQNVEDEKLNLLILLGQTSSLEEIKSLLNQLNSSFLQIGKLAEKHRDELLNVIRMQQFDQFNFDQPYRIYYNNESNFEFELLLNATLKTFKQSMKTFLHNLTITTQTPPLRERKYFINLTNDAGQNGDFNLQDALFTYDDLHLLINEQSDDAKKLLKSSWSASSAIPKLTLLLNQRVLDANKNWKLLEKNYPLISLAPIPAVADSAENRFSSELELELEKFFNKVPVDQLMQNSKSTGTLKITKPCLYIFPASQGDSAYFAVNGYSVLINGGYDKLRPCFWKFINMLQQIDSILITHTDADTLGGLSSFFKKKLVEPDTKPAVLSVLGNLIASSNGRQPSIVNVAANLISQEVVSASKQAHQSDVDQIIDAIDKLQVKLLPLVKTNENLLTSLNRSNHALNKYEHINLYYKLGHGSLDLYVLSPYVNSIDYKEYYQQQHHGSVLKHMANQKSHLAVQQIYRHLPLSHLASAVVLLVWLPTAPTRQSAANADNNALRLLFTGNAPQHVIFNALDKIKDFELLNEPVYRVKATESSTATTVNAGGRKSSQIVKDLSSLNSSQVANGSSAKPASKTSAAAASSSASAKQPTGEKSTSGGQTNGNHHAESNKSQPNATASQAKSSTVAAKPPKPAVGSASSKDKDSSGAAKDSSAKPEASGSSKPEVVKKHPPIPSHNVPSTSKAKKADAAESSSSASASAEKSDKDKADGKEKKPSSRPSVTSSSNVKKELINGAGEKASTNGTSVKQSQSETSASGESKPTLSASGTSRSSLAKPDSNKPASKPQSAPSTSKPAASSKSTTSTTASSTGDKKESSAKKPSSAAGRSSTAGQTEPKNVVKKEKSAKTLSLSVDKSTPAAAAATAATAATAVAASAVVAGAVDDATAVPTPEAVAPDQSPADHEPSKNDSVEVPKQEQEESTSEMTERVVHEEQIEQIEKIEQVVNVEQQIEQIEQSLKEPIVELENVHLQTAEPNNKDEFVAMDSQPTEQQHDVQVQPETPVVEPETYFEQKYLSEQEPEQEPDQQQQQHQQNLIDVAEPATPTSTTPSGQFGNESPNLSPVKKDFINLNGESNLVDDDGVVVVAPVVEEQLTNGSAEQLKNDADLIIDNNTDNGRDEFEIVSSNLNPTNAAPAVSSATILDTPVADFYRGNEDVMTRSFIEDESNPQSNPFNQVDSNAQFVTPVLQTAPAVNGHKNLDESCDLNRTHELFEGDDSSLNIQEDSVSKSVPSEMEDKLINGIESLKLDSHHHQDQDPTIQLEPVETARGDEPEHWNLLELPSPVNPIDPISPLETQSKLAANELNQDLNTSNQQAPLIEELPVSSDFAPTNASNVPGSAEKKSLINGKKAGGAQSSGRASVDPSSQQAANKAKTNQTSSQNQAQNKTNKPSHPVHVHPVYVELTYIPAHGNEHYCDAEFFKRVRARHYVLSSVEPSENVLNALCDAKEQWEDKNLQVTLVPTYETETLRKWFVANEERLIRLKIGILPAANNATITIDDDADLTCPVYKLEF